MRGLNLRGAAVAVALLCGSLGAQAALFEDDEARRAILDLRQRVEAMRAQSEQRQNDENAQLRRSLLDLQNQIEQMRNDMQRMTGQNEQLSRTVAEMQQRQGELNDKLKQNEPAKVALDGREFTADPREKADFDAALGVFRGGQFAQAQTAFAEFVKRYPQSGYNASALFWLGNAQYARRDYKEAISTFRSLVASAPDSPRAPEAMLAIANCQAELKDTKAARKTIDDLLKAYPKSEAAQAGRERLAALR